MPADHIHSLSVESCRSFLAGMGRSWFVFVRLLELLPQLRGSTSSGAVRKVEDCKYALAWPWT